MIPAEIKKEIESRLSEISGSKILIMTFTPVTGGCINYCFHLETSSGAFFLKYNDASAYPNMFKAEASGLQLLREANAIPVPFVHFHGEVKEYSFLLLEWIDGDKQKKKLLGRFRNVACEAPRSEKRSVWIGSRQLHRFPCAVEYKAS
jgi:fructosamine-3-kinase